MASGKDDEYDYLFKGSCVFFCGECVLPYSVFQLANIECSRVECIRCPLTPPRPRRRSSSSFSRFYSVSNAASTLPPMSRWLVLLFLLP